MTRQRLDLLKLPALQKWHEQTSPSLGVWDYLGSQPDGITRALAFAHLFWPEFIEVQGCVLLAHAYNEEAFARWWRELAGDRRRIELVINHVHLYDLFPGDEELAPEVVEAALAELGEIVVSCWSCALATQFRDRKFHVELRSGEQEYGPTIYFSTAEVHSG